MPGLPSPWCRLPGLWHVARGLGGRLETATSQVEGHGPSGDRSQRRHNFSRGSGSEDLGALQKAAKSEFRETDALRDAIVDYVGLREAARRLRPHRPFGRPYGLSQRIIDGLGSLIEQYLKAFAARTPLEAQNHGEAGQRILDALAGTADELNDWLERQAAIDEASGVAESLAALISDAVEMAGADTLIDLATHHQTRLADLLGGPVDPGLAVSFAVQSSVAELLLDPDRYVSKLRDVGGIFGSADDKLDSLLRDPDFQADLHRLELDLFDSAVQCQHAIATATLPRQAAKAVVALNKSLVEAAGRLVAAPLLVAVRAKSKPYAKLRHDNATELIGLVNHRPSTANLVAGLDPHLRTADSHSAITYGDNSLTTDLVKGGKTYDYGDLSDATFEALESCFAVMLGVRHAMALRGILHKDEGGLESLGLTPQEIVDVCMPAFGASVDSATLTDRRLVLVASSPAPSRVSVALVGTLTSLAPHDVEVVELVLSDGQRWSVSASAYRDRDSDADDFEKQLALIRIQAAWRNDAGDSWLSNDALRKWTAVQAGEALGLDTPAKFRRLRELRRLLDDLGDADFAEALRAFITLVRLQEQGDRPTAREASSIETIRSWLDRDVDVVLL
jgi:hypothetical protein